MATTTALDIAVPEDVLAEVKRKSAEVEFENFRERVLEHFPDARGVDVRILADPDEDDRNWIVFDVVLAMDTTPEVYSDRKREFYSRLMEGRPHVVWPICTLSLKIAKG